jgi:hypothetical protein
MEINCLTQETDMAKGQKRSNRETKKPKKEIAKKGGGPHVTTAAPALAIGQKRSLGSKRS